jgi:glucose-1-phosphate cytidylyltransferase
VTLGKVYLRKSAHLRRRQWEGTLLPVKVMILCGGQGTRIRGVSEDVPKPMLPIGGMPILWHIMKYYASYGHTDFVLCLGHKGSVIKDFFLNYQYRVNDITIELGSTPSITVHTANEPDQWSVTLAETGDDTQTGGRVASAMRYIRPDESFMLTYGDGVSDVPIDRLLEWHKQSASVMTVTGVMPPGRFGEIQADEHGKAVAFNEKPQVSGGLISGGFFVCNPEIRDVLTGGETEILERAPMLSLVERSELSVYRHDGFWQCMDTPRDWSYLNDLATNGKAPWIRW